MKFSYVVLVIMLTCSGCGEPEEGPVLKQDKNWVSSLKYLQKNGIKYPFVQYENTAASETKMPDNGGELYFIHPMFEERNRILKLEYEFGQQRFEELFGEELFGNDGSVELLNDTYQLSSSYISIPENMKDSASWKIKQGGHMLICNSRLRESKERRGGLHGVSCKYGDVELTFVFDETRGVTNYEAPCGDKICGYQLVGNDGLLSPKMIEHMQIK